MPKMGESITEGTIVKWLKKEGDAVNKDENILLITTDKVEAEIPSPDKGFLVEIKYQEGDTLPVGEILGAISSSKDNSPDKSNIKNEDDQENTVITDSSQFLSPLVKKLLVKYNIDKSMINRIEGSGRNNRITKMDIINFVNSNNENINKEKPSTQNLGIENNKPIRSEYSNRDNNIDNVKPEMPSEDVKGNIIQKDISNLRRKIMDNMVKSKEISAHVSTFFKVDYSNISRYRKEYMNQNNGYKLTYTDFVVASVAKVLNKHPYINSEIRNNKLLLKQDINLGVAVSVSEPEPGLLVPVIKNANQLNILGISQEIKNLSTKVRNKKINIDDLSHGTFTITNPGNYGAVTNTPIINQPQVAILGVGTIHKETVVKQFNNIDTISIGEIGWICLTFDHRVVDGVIADSFMRDLKNDLEAWSLK